MKKTSLKAKVLWSILAIAIIATALFFMVKHNAPPISTPNATAPATTKQVVYDYNGLRSAIADIPRKEALDEMYIVLSGYWIVKNDDSFVAFSTNKDGNHEVEYGLFDTGFARKGEIIGGHAISEYEAELIIRIPAQKATEMADSVPEHEEKVYIDLTDLSKHTNINFKTENLKNGIWQTFDIGGTSLEDANSNR